METAVIAALAGLLGIALGRVWDSRSEEVRWRRDQRIRVYEQLAGAYYSLREALRVLAMTEPNTPEADAAEDRFYELTTDFNREILAVWLHCSNPVTRASKHFGERMNELLFQIRVRENRYVLEEFKDRCQPMTESFEAFIEAVRQEFRRPPVKVVIRPDLHRQSMDPLKPRIRPDSVKL